MAAPRRPVEPPPVEPPVNVPAVNVPAVIVPAVPLTPPVTATPVTAPVAPVTPAIGIPGTGAQPVAFGRGTSTARTAQTGTPLPATQAASPGAEGSLARTGSDSGSLAVLASMVILFGTLLVRFAGRRARRVRVS